ncbi:MAG: hypothetical protein JJ863_19745 [Deltaproteobacteria bacterium]|nr:hypothetical protein [Deltaproteobacteria bacterium]
MTSRSILAAVLILAATTTAQADDDPITVTLTPLTEYGPYKAKLTIIAHADREVVIDRRLLQLTVRPQVEGRRRSPRLRCRHPNEPRRADRTREMSAGETYEEWIDLRMYCWGRPLRALEAGPATIEVGYGFRRGGRGRFVAREEGERRPPRSVDAEPYAWVGPSAAEDSENESPVEVGLRPTSARGEPLLRPTIRATEGRPRAYLRDDLWSFTVRGPLGSVECRPSRQVIAPIVDFFSRLSSRPRTESFAVEHYCPDDTFAVPGVYEVTPRVELIYDADRFDFDAVTGTFEGAPAPVRRTRGEYVEQTLESLEAFASPESS